MGCGDKSRRKDGERCLDGGLTPPHPWQLAQASFRLSKAPSLSLTASTSPAAASVRSFSARHALTDEVRSISGKDATASSSALRKSTRWPNGNVRSFASVMALTPSATKTDRWDPANPESPKDRSSSSDDAG